ncbi:MULTISPECIES: SIS domain-containing protein [Pseudoalteromonas]|uniref:DnaA initiator-associating protein DiaA n=1 Tax=Pseudoalteromonas rubra TaxID=43658 RepID=A0A0L0EXK6_9GAMM|nr:MULTISPECIES: SIS domain-containing protein [Pseudoalteromonas]ALU43987.1 DnaA initiator-associating protein DiaA [Pseudoalteromonas rubra]KAF7788608.1 DnaA initiator-associating protein [Pseudoalteromonas rubra]KNC69202.1 DnaA initiator-associating protein DiaA [Pseudoalteromonas rubra]MCG7562058.1 SIS domain-containing protein [Pseudoalteromonas sp. McH1-42]MDK1311852.1 SIS domain-containing protein [Pseudoalteromonas sp. R96]
MQESIKEIFTESIQAQIAAGEALPEVLESTAYAIAQCLINGNKLICCGVPSCHMMAEHFSNLLVNYFETERPCLPALTLSQTQINLSNNDENQGSDYFARQVRAISNENDLLFVVAIDGHEKSVISAVEAALTNDLNVIALIGDDGGELTGLLGPNDVEIRVPSKRASRILETHLFTVHCLSQLIDNILFPQDA